MNRTLQRPNTEAAEAEGGGERVAAVGFHFSGYLGPVVSLPHPDPLEFEMSLLSSLCSYWRRKSPNALLAVAHVYLA